MNYHEIYNIARDHSMHVHQWHSDLMKNTLDELIENGEVVPSFNYVCWNPIKNAYGFEKIHIDIKEIADVNNNQNLIERLRKIAIFSKEGILAACFISEGTLNIDKGNENVLLITYENGIISHKSVYRYLKNTSVSPFGAIKTSIDNVWYDPVLCNAVNIPELNKFSSILRPNYFDEKCHIYN